MRGRWACAKRGQRRYLAAAYRVCFVIGGGVLVDVGAGVENRGRMLRTRHIAGQAGIVCLTVRPAALGATAARLGGRSARKRILWAIVRVCLEFNGWDVALCTGVRCDGSEGVKWGH